MNMNMDFMWFRHVNHIMKKGHEISPRKMLTKEITPGFFFVDMTSPILTLPQRKLSYKFMAAEALWIISGDNLVSSIAKYNKNIAAFSDDGKKFAGAYGPPVTSQLPYVINTLFNEPESRQAALTIWQPNPAPSKDIPCTIAMTFTIRNQTIDTNVFMRSSDAWLGLPYDVFNFTTITVYIACAVNKLAAEMRVKPIIKSLGHLSMLLGSAHIYEKNFEDIRAITAKPLDETKPILCVNHVEDWEEYKRQLLIIRDESITESGYDFERMPSIASSNDK